MDENHESVAVNGVILLQDALAGALPWLFSFMGTLGVMHIVNGNYFLSLGIALYVSYAVSSRWMAEVKKADEFIELEKMANE